MGEFADLIQQGVYCENCGCYTGVEPGHTFKCQKCYIEEMEREVEDAYERGERL